MENSSDISVDRKPILPVESELQSQVNSPAKPNGSKTFSFLTVLLLAGAFLAGYFTNSARQAVSTPPNQNFQEKNTVNPTASPSTVVSKAAEKVSTEFLFTTDPNRDAAYDLQAWLLSLSGEKKRLDLPDFSIVYKYPDSSKVFYTVNAAPLQQDVRAIVYVKDLLTDETKQFELTNHPKADVNESINIDNLKSIAPDGSMLVYNVFYFENCPPVSVEPGFQGGFGPCEPSPEPGVQNGYFLYDFSTQKNTHLGETVIPSRWDLENKKFYFSTMDYQNNGLKVLDLETKQVSMYNKADTFGYGAVPLLKSNMIAKVEGQTGDVAGQSSSSTLNLYNLETKETKVLDSGRWAEIQPFISVSPNETKFVYIRTKLDGQGRGIDSLHSYDFATGELKRITPESTISSYSHSGWWLDEDTFVTSVNETGSNFDNGKNFIVKIDLLSGQMTKLTDGNVYRFHQN